MALSIYSVCLKDSVQMCLTRFSDMFNNEEIEYISGFISLGDDEVNLISRMINRKHHWLRSNTLQHYVINADSFGKTLTNLISLGCILQMNENLRFNEIWEAMCTVINLDEWRRLYSILKLSNKTCSTSTIVMMKSEIFRILMSQKPLFGSVETNLLSLIKKIVGDETSLVRINFKLIKTLRRMQRLAQVNICTSLISASLLNITYLTMFS